MIYSKTNKIGEEVTYIDSPIVNFLLLFLILIFHIIEQTE